MAIYLTPPSRTSVFLHVRDGAGLPGLAPALYRMADEAAGRKALRLLYGIQPEGDIYDTEDAVLVACHPATSDSDWTYRTVGFAVGDPNDLYAFIARHMARALNTISPNGTLGQVAIGALQAASPAKPYAPLLLPPPVITYRGSAV